ncbi:MAG: dienelactone hydrolase family protein [Planctomycetes bacterium]|nr:dienelactone hydrolase family protein [Planctomycetota bacterium]
MSHRRAALVALLSLAPAPALAQDAFDVRMADRALGREVVTAGDAAVVSSASLQVVPGAPAFVYEQRTTLDAEGRLAAYALTSQTHELAVEVTPVGAAVRARVVGQGHERTLPGAGPWLVLDNLVFAHYDLLGRAMRGRDEATLQVIVPQALAVLPGTCTATDGAPVSADGVERPTRLLKLTLASTLVEVRVDAETGVAYHVRVPSQRLEALREGVALEPRPVPVSDPAPCRELDVTFEAPLGPVPGTLTLPADGEGPWPVVVFLHPSGPSDRDQTIGPNKPFRDLAHDLARDGVASLRFEKRTQQLVAVLRDQAAAKEQRQAALDVLNALTLEEESIQDGVAALAFLATRPEVRADARYVLGHSLGALAAPAVARQGGAKGVIMLAGPGRRMDVLLEEQLTYQGTVAGLTPAQAAAAAREKVAPLRAGLAEDASFLGATGRYWNDVVARDPASEVAALEVPLLLVHAEADCQVLQADVEALEAAARGAGVAVARASFPGLNHLFMPVEGRSTGAEYFVEGRVDPRVSLTVAEWVLRAGAPPGEGDR